MSRVRVPSIALFSTEDPRYLNMTLWQALILGTLQGITEFFPVSSSTHLHLAKICMGIDQTAEGSAGSLLFDIYCHAGTLFVLGCYFWRDLKRIGSQTNLSQANLYQTSLYHKEVDQKAFQKALCQQTPLPSHLVHNNSEPNPENPVPSFSIHFLHLALALLPLIPGYFLCKSIRMHTSSHSIAFFLMVSAFLLLISELFHSNFSLQKETNKMTLRHALCIGIAQAFALFPGISRSAATLSTARFLGFSRKNAVLFSFLLSIPTISGGLALELLQAWKRGLFLEDSFANSLPLCLMGFCSSLIVGGCVIRFAMGYLQNKSWIPFAVYCLGVGVCSWIWGR